MPSQKGTLNQPEAIMRRFPALALVATLLLAGCGNESMMTAPEVMEEETPNTSNMRMGDFEALNGKETSGSATLKALNEEMLQLMFSTDFSLTDGPGLNVFLSNAEYVSGDAIDLGRFISPTGAQNYAIPDGVSLDDYTHVVVYCVPFSVIFAYAELE